ncbi:UNVERIFIED_CONTAM: hypothetical protein RMT77_013148 [Armadillidium vulgare]
MNEEDIDKFFKLIFPYVRLQLPQNNEDKPSHIMFKPIFAGDNSEPDYLMIGGMSPVSEDPIFLSLEVPDDAPSREDLHPPRSQDDLLSFENDASGFRKLRSREQGIPENTEGLSINLNTYFSEDLSYEDYEEREQEYEEEQDDDRDTMLTEDGEMFKAAMIHIPESLFTLEKHINKTENYLKNIFQIHERRILQLERKLMEIDGLVPTTPSWNEPFNQPAPPSTRSKVAPQPVPPTSDNNKKKEEKCVLI